MRSSSASIPMASSAPPIRAPTAPPSAASVAPSVAGVVADALLALARTLDRGVTVCAFMAAGCLRFETLGRHMAANWRHFGATQTQPEVAAGLFHWEEAFYGRFVKAGERVLLVGCGSGRDLLPLLERGCRAEGLEPVAECAALARERLAQRGLTAPVRTADITSAALEGWFDAVIFSWLCYSYIPVRERRIAVLQRVTAHLADGGRILVSYVLAQPPPRRLPWRLACLASRATRADWRPEYGDVFVARPDTRAIHFEHQFQPAEIEAEARAAGLAVTYHDLSGDGYIALVAAPSRG
jgi:SAM-dependent methyltransferase